MTNNGSTTIMTGADAQKIITTYHEWIQHPIQHNIAWPTTDILVKYDGINYLLMGSAATIQPDKIKFQLMDHEPTEEELEALPIYTLILFLNEWFVDLKNKMGIELEKDEIVEIYDKLFESAKNRRLDQ